MSETLHVRHVKNMNTIPDVSLTPERTDRSGNRSGDSKGPERLFFLQTKKNKNKKIKNLNSD